MADSQIILGNETEERVAAQIEQREASKLRKAGLDPEVVKIVPREGKIKGNTAPASTPDVVSIAPKGSGARQRDGDGKYATPKSAFETSLAKHMGKVQDQNVEGVKAGEPAKAEPTEADAPKVQESEALKEAKGHWKLAGFDESDLEGLSEDRIVKLGQKAHAQTVQFAKRLERDAKAAKEPTAPAKVQEAAKADPTEDLIATAAKGFSEKYEGEFGQEIADFGRTLVKASAEKMTALEQRLAISEARAEAVLVKDAVSGLRERFPQLDQPENVTKLHGQMAELAELKKDGEPRYSDHVSLAADAAKLLWGDEVAATARAKAEDKSEAKRSGQPISAKRDATSKPKTPEEVHNARLKAAMSGASREEIRAIV